MTKEEAIKILMGYSHTPQERAALEILIPELVESEDERMLREIKRYIKEQGDKPNGLPNGTVSVSDMIAWLEKQKYNRMQPVYDNQESFESALDKAWKSYNECGSRTVDSFEDDYIECAHAKGFREGYLFGLEEQKEYISNNFNDVWDEEDCEEIIAEGQKLTPRFKELLKEVCHAWYDRGAKLEKQKEQKPLKVGESAYFDPNTEMWFIKEEQKPAEFTHHETNESLKDAVTHQMEDDGDVDDFVRRGIDDIALKYAELGAKWQKEQKPEWSEDEFHKTTKLVYRAIRKVLSSLAVYAEDEALLDSKEETLCYYSQHCAEEIFKSINNSRSYDN